MLAAAELCLAAPDGRRLPSSAGSLLHGALMERLDGTLVASLHTPGLRPYSQHLWYDGEKMIWRVAALTHEATEAIINPLLSSDSTSIYLRDKQLSLTITERRLLYSSTYRELADRFFLAAHPVRRVVLRFLTPTSFKSDNAYLIYPDVRHIMQSLYNRWNAFASWYTLEDQDALQHLITHTRIIGYRLRMSPFSVEGIRIPAFQGNVELYLAGPDALARLTAMLLTYAEFAGIGIKTALGMGGSRIYVKQRGTSSLTDIQSLLATPEEPADGS